MKNTIPGIEVHKGWISAPGYEGGRFWIVANRDTGKSIVAEAKTWQQACWIAAETIGLNWKKAEDRDKMHVVRTVQPGAW